MSTNNDALREAMKKAVQHFDSGQFSAGDAVLREALAASNPEPQAQDESIGSKAQQQADAEPQAQAGEPEDDLTVAYMCGVEAGKDHMREAIAKKDAALKACVEAGKEVVDADDAGELTTELINSLRAAITQAQEAQR